MLARPSRRSLRPLRRSVFGPPLGSANTPRSSGVAATIRMSRLGLVVVTGHGTIVHTGQPRPVCGATKRSRRCFGGLWVDAPALAGGALRQTTGGGLAASPASLTRASRRTTLRLGFWPPAHARCTGWAASTAALARHEPRRPSPPPQPLRSACRDARQVPQGMGLTTDDGRWRERGRDACQWACTALPARVGTIPDGPSRAAAPRCRCTA